jgi:LmbE family N-acetylglucosaminyl deacetylase
LAVFAHPDDEAFGLGATLASWASRGAEVSVLTLTRGEKSTLGEGDATELGALRARELRASLTELGVRHRLLWDLPDGGLDQLPGERLVDRIAQLIKERRPQAVVTYHWNGITGHPDHRRTTWAVAHAALNVVRALPGYKLSLYFWALLSSVTEAIRQHVGVELPGIPEELLVAVDAREGRPAQDRAIAAHASQGGAGPTMAIRFAVQAGREYFVVRALDSEVAGLAELGVPTEDPAGSCGVVAGSC